MTRREVLSLPFLAAAQQRKLNVLFILADDLGWSDLGAYGADLHETPNLDALARSSVRFTNAYSAAPICSPTRASIMTGKHPARLHMTIWLEGAKRRVTNQPLIPPATVWNLPHSEVTMGERFREQGYLTAAIGKWHLGEATHYPETQGFDINIGGTLWGAPQTYFAPYRGNKRFGGEERYVPHLEGAKPGEYLTDRLASEALRVIESARQQPFFVYLAHHNPHTPIEGKPALAEKYKARVKAGMRHQNAAYAAMIETLDANVGRMIDGLKRAGKLDSTLVVRRQLFFPVDDNYSSLSATTTVLAKLTLAPMLVLTGAEDKALQGCNLSADSGARTRLGGGFRLAPSASVRPKTGIAGMR